MTQVASSIDIGKDGMWISQAGGNWKEKKGKIIAFVLKGYLPKDYLPAGTKREDGTLIASRIKFDSLHMPRNDDHYLIQVPRPNSKLFDYYLPRCTQVSIEGGEEA